MITSRIMKWVGHLASMGERRGLYRVSVRLCVGKRPLGRPRHRWEDNIKQIFKKWGGGFHWIILAQDMNRWRALGNAIMILGAPYNAENFLPSRESVSFSRLTLVHGVSK